VIGSARDPLDRALDVGLGLTALGWSAAGLVVDDDLPFAARAAISTVNVVVGVLFVLRSAAARQPAASDFVAALPSIVLSGFAYRYAAHDWPVAGLVVFGVASAFTVVALFSLGRSFSIFPAQRPLVVRGPYALVRHPVYLGELAMLVTAAATGGPLPAVACFVAMLLLLIPRIRREEAALALGEGHAAYAARVRFRLIPGVY
jgi:protein-S-isoprenylcysteine O-methyltransferase Ste14